MRLGNAIRCTDDLVERRERPGQLVERLAARRMLEDDALHGGRNIIRRAELVELSFEHVTIVIVSSKTSSSRSTRVPAGAAEPW